MKKTRRFASLATAAILAACAVVPATMSALPVSAADTTYSITVNNNAENHTYEAYQIFKGSLGTDNTLGNIEWGAGVNSTATDFLTTIQAVKGANNTAPFTGKTTAKEIAEVLSANNTDSTLAINFADAISKFLSTSKATQDTQTADADNDGVKEYVLSDLTAGYYLVKDKDATQNGKDDAYTSFIMRVVANTTATPKSAKPTVDKQVLDETDDAEAGATEGWGESADHAINESFQFKLTATLNADAQYANYEQYKVVFTDTMSKGVTFESIESVKITGKSADGDDIAETVNAPGYTKSDITAGTDGAQKWTLTIDDIKTAAPGIDLTKGATVEVIYSAHLNADAIVSKKGATAEVVNNNKVSLEYSNNPNAGGEGNLGKTPEDYVWVFTYGVDNTKVDQEQKPLAGAGFKLYDAAGTNEISLIYDATKNAYRPTAAGETGKEMFSADKTGVFNIIGLDAGSYQLKETTTPAGYNTCEPIDIVISATHVENANAASADLTLKADTANMNNTIINQKGSTLPSTGGIGTTIFYVAGGVLVVGAGVLLITKKRAKDAQ